MAKKATKKHTSHKRPATARAKRHSGLKHHAHPDLAWITPYEATPIPAKDKPKPKVLAEWLTHLPKHQTQEHKDYPAWVALVMKKNALLAFESEYAVDFAQRAYSARLAFHKPHQASGFCTVEIPRAARNAPFFAWMEKFFKTRPEHDLKKKMKPRVCHCPNAKPAKGNRS